MKEAHSIMYKVLIIDDEESVREAIKILGEWEKLEIDEVIEAQDGKTGMSLLSEKKPDIVLLDMHMPEMNGVEFLQAVEKEYSHAVNIVISGFDDYEFTRQAIRSKVFDYLLKPVNGQQLNTALSNAINSIQTRREKQRDNLERSAKMNLSLQTLKEKIFISAIDGSFNTYTNGSYLKMIGVDDSVRCYGIAIIRILNFSRVSKSDFGNDSDTLYFAIINITDEICRQYIKLFCYRNSRAEKEIVLVLLDDHESTEEVRRLTYEALKRVVRKLRELLGIEAVVGIGCLNSGFSVLAGSYKTAITYLNGINLLEPGESVVSESSKRINVQRYSILNKMALIKNALENGSLEYAINILREHINKIKESNYFSLREASKTLNEFIFMMNDIALEIDMGSDLLQDFKSSIEARGVCFDYAGFEEFTSLLCSITTYFYEKVRRQMKSSQKFDTQSIKDYVDKNYYQEIKISMFAEKYYLSKVYIMKLFKQVYGCSIYEYVQKVRMGKAIELLEDSKINIQNISQMVGYSNNNYFSKAFKNYYHISPSGYRMTVLKQIKAI
jgi:two-component system response regulator YesN